MTQPFTLLIEPTGKPSFQHGLHLGTDERLARQIAEETFHERNKMGIHTRTVTLKRQGRVVAIYDGGWDRCLSDDLGTPG